MKQIRLSVVTVIAMCGLSLVATEIELNDFSFDGYANWFEQGDIIHDGGTAWQSGSIGNSQYSDMSKTFVFPSAGTLLFYWKVSSENNYDYLTFYVDGVAQGKICGEIGWELKSYSLTSGEHTIKWRYSKDGSNYNGSDCGWVDQIIWTDAIPVYLNANKGECDKGFVGRNFGTTVGSLPTPTRQDCRFLGWFTQKVGGERVTSSTVVSDTITLWAHWQPTYEWQYTTDNVNGVARLDGVTPNLEGVVTLPNVIDGYRVVSIGDNAFAGHDELMELTIQGNVTNIGSCAFANCSGMTRIVVSASVAHVANNAFTGCDAIRSAVTPGWFGNFIPSTFITNAVIVSGTERIDAYAFQNRTELKSVSIPDSVNRIGIGAFDNCHEDLYDTVTRPGLILVDGWVVGYDVDALAEQVDLNLTGLRGVADGAFDRCTNLVHVTIPNNVRNIGSQTFRNCENLKGVMMPHGLLEIGESAFRGCASMRIIEIPAGVTNVAEEAFWACSELSNVAVLSTNCTFGLNAFGQCFALREATLSQAALDRTLQTVFPGVFQDITNVTLAAGVTNISNNAFSGCTGLFSLAIPNGVTRIGVNAFAGCTSLTNVSNAADVEIIGQRAFQNSGLKTFTMPASVTNVHSEAFLNCVDLLRVDAEDMESWCRIRFADRDANPVGLHTLPDRHCDLYSNGQIVQDLIIPAHVDVLGPFTFAENTNIVSVIALSGLTEIGDSAFLNCGRLESLTLPEGILVIRWNAFEGCASLDNLIIPASVTEISDRAFWNCTSLSHLTLLETEDGIDNNSFIGASAFEGCTALTAVIIPSRIGVLGSAVFRGCDHLKSVYYLGSYAPIREGDATDIYQGTPDVLLTYVKKDSIGWKDGDGSSNLPTKWPDNNFNGRGIRTMPQVTCTVTFDSNGGTPAKSEVKRDAGQLLGEISQPVRKGYSFDGWFTAKTGGAKVSDNSIVTANVSLYAHWTLLPIYDITFDANGGSGTTVIGISEGETISAFPVVSRYGCSVDGWWTEPSGGTQVTVDSVISNAATYWVHWRNNVYDVKLDANGGDGTSTRKIVHGTAVGTLPELPRTGFTFDGWWTEPSGGTQVTSATAIYSETTFWAHWTTASYIVTFDSADGSGVVNRNVNHGSSLGTLPSPQRANYAFDGWWTAVSGGTLVNSSTVVTGPVTFWAHWTEVKNGNDRPIDQPIDLSEVVTYGGVVQDVSFESARTVQGVLYDAKGKLSGTVELKFGKKGKMGVKVSGAATIIQDGKAKKVTAKAVNMNMGTSGASMPIEFKEPVGNMTLAMGADGVFTLKGTKYEMVGATVTAAKGLSSLPVGGVVQDGTLHFNVAINKLPDFGKDGVVLDVAIPKDVPVSVSGGKWFLGKAASPKYKKDRMTGETKLVGLDDPAKPNISGLKLNYTAKTGVFKGAFKMYTTIGGDKPKLKKFTVNVVGFVVNGVGYGEATMKKPVGGPWTVTVQ